MNPIRLSQKAWTCYRDIGIDEVFMRTLKKIGFLSVAHSLDMYFHELERFSAPLLTGITTRELFPAELDHLTLEEGLPSLQKFQKEFDRGSRLYGALQGNTLVAMNWFNSRVADLTHIGQPSISLPENTVYSYWMAVAPSFQRKGVGSFLKQTLLQTIKREGFHFVIIAVYVTNLSAAQWHQKNGFLKWGRIYYFKAGEKQKWWTCLTPYGKRHPNLLEKALCAPSL